MLAMAPEWQILTLNAVILGVAYLGIYPGLQIKSINRIMAVDLVLTVVALTTAGALFWGSDVQFNMLFFNTNWFVFTLITLILIEALLAYRFMKKHNITLSDDNS